MKQSPSPHKAKRPILRTLAAVLILFLLGGIAVHQYLGAERLKTWWTQTLRFAGLPNDNQIANGNSIENTPAARVSLGQRLSTYIDDIAASVDKITTSATEALKNAGVDVAGWRNHPEQAGETVLANASSSKRVTDPRDEIRHQATEQEGGATKQDQKFSVKVSDYSSRVTETVKTTYKSAVEALSRSFGFGMHGGDRARDQAAEQQALVPQVEDLALDAEQDISAATQVDRDADRKLKSEGTTVTPAPSASSADPGNAQPKQHAKPVKMARISEPKSPAAQAPVPRGRRPTFNVVSFDGTGEGVAAGEAEPNWQVHVVANGQTIATTDVDQRGQWVILFDRLLKPGEHKLKLKAVAPNGRGSLLSAQTVDVRFASQPDGRYSRETPYVAILEPNKPVRVLQKPRRFKMVQRQNGNNISPPRQQASGQAVVKARPSAQTTQTKGAEPAKAKPVRAEPVMKSVKTASKQQQARLEKRIAQLTPKPTPEKPEKNADLIEERPNPPSSVTRKAITEKAVAGKSAELIKSAAQSMAGHAKAAGKAAMKAGDVTMDKARELAGKTKQQLARLLSGQHKPSARPQNKSSAAVVAAPAALAEVPPPVKRDRRLKRQPDADAKILAKRTAAIKHHKAASIKLPKRNPHSRAQVKRLAQSNRVPKVVVVRHGDSLWTIAQKIYGDGSKYRLLSKANNLKKPYKIYPKQVLKIPRLAQNDQIESTSRNRARRNKKHS